MQVKSCLVRRIACGHQHHSRPCERTVTIEISPGRLGEQDSRPVVAREDEGAFDGAGRENDFPGPHLPLALPGLAVVGSCQMVAQALIESEQIVREVAEGGRTRQQRDPWMRREHLQSACQPAVGRLSLDHCVGMGARF